MVAVWDRKHLSEPVLEAGQTRPAAPHGAPALTTRLQALAGNRAVTSILQRAVVQRQPSSAGPTSGGPEDAHSPVTDGASDRDLEALLAQIAATLPSAPRVPAFEAITATTAGEFSAGELETDIQRLWKRERLTFTESAGRTAARGDDRTGPRATRSPHIEPAQRYALRWAVNLFAADYPRNRSDLPDVGRIARRGSPYRRALEGEVSRAIAVNNPTAKKIESSIFDAIMAMWTALEPGANGEIVVTYAGHGGGGSITGVDWGTVGVEQLRSLARLGADFNVHVVYILDTCRAGGLAIVAGADALRDAEEGIGRLPADRQPDARARGAFAHQLGRALVGLNNAVMIAGDAARKVRRQRTDANRLAAFLTFHDVFEANSTLGTVLQGSARTQGLPSTSRLAEAQDRLGWSILSAWTGDPAGATAALRRAAVALDEGMDVFNATVAALDSETRSASRSTGGARASAGVGSR